jgi:hypothetical protein
LHLERQCTEKKPRDRTGKVNWEIWDFVPLSTEIAKALNTKLDIFGAGLLGLFGTENDGDREKTKYLDNV